MQHPSFSRFLPCALALVVMTWPLSSAAAQQIYRWKDANGTVNFTHMPPPNGQSAQKTLTLPSAPDASSAPAAPSGADYVDGMSSSAQQPSQPRANANECLEARRQLKLMASGAEVAHLGSDGKPAPLEGAARAQEMQRLREFVLKSCEQ